MIEWTKTDHLCYLKDEWEKCTRCPLHENRNKVVMGRGNPDAPLVLIGEAPGADEDEFGVPFVGKAGKLLDRLLKTTGLDPDKDVYITNVVGCRPPGNRAPTTEEANKCARLILTLDILKPGALLLLGGVAAKRVAKIPTITKWRGEKVDVELFDVMWNVFFEGVAVPTFHPSYLLRMGGNIEIKRAMIQDIKAAWRLANAF